MRSIHIARVPVRRDQNMPELRLESQALLYQKLMPKSAAFVRTFMASVSSYPPNELYAQVMPIQPRLKGCQ